MKRLVAVFTVGCLSLTCNPLLAQQPTERDFVHALRARGLPDYALEYLQSVSQKPPPSLAQVLPLEMAKLRTDLAQLEPDLARRNALFTQARAEFQAFLKKNPKSDETAEAALELGRTISRQGKVQVLEAERQNTPEARKAGMEKAKALFTEAAKQLDAAAALIEPPAAKSPTAPKPPATETKPPPKPVKAVEPPAAPKNGKRLAELKDQLDLERGINYIELFQSYEDTDIQVRPQVAKKALEALKKIGGNDEKKAVYWVGKAWLGRYYFEIQDYRSARGELDKVLKTKEPQADAGQRLAGFFQLLVMDKDPDAKKNVLPAKVKAAEEWLKKHSEARRTPEGYGVQFQLGEALLAQAQLRPKTVQANRDTQQLYERAESLFNSVEKAETEFSRQARDSKLRSILARSGERSRGDVGKLKDFQECYLRAQLEVWQMNQDEKDPPKGAKPEDLKKKRTEHLANTVGALNRAVELADAETSATDLGEARFMLAYLYLREMDDPYRAAILGEHLARGQPQSSRAPGAAAFALQAYYQILTEDEGNEATAPGILQADRNQLKQLAAYMEKTWPTDPATGLARHQLGSMALRDKKYAEALSYLSRVPETYGAYTQSQFQLAAAAMQAQKAGLKPAQGQPAFTQQAVAALRKIPDLSAAAEPAATQVYFLGKMELAKLLFATKQYDEMAALTTQILKRYEETKGKIGEEVKKEISPTLKVLPIYAQFGQADGLFKAGKFAETRKVLDPVVDQIQQNKLPDLKDPMMIRTLMGLALRTSVRAGDTKRAQEILTALLAKSGDSLESTSAILGDLVVQLRGQVEDLRRKGDAGKEELDKTVKSFTAFLDEVAKQPAEKLNPDLLGFLARGYAGLDKHKEAADLLSRIPPPKAPAKDETDQEKEAAFREQRANYRGIQIMHVRELRLSKQFDKATDKLRELFRTDWGAKAPEVLKERNSLWEDEGKFAPAAKGWSDLMSTLQPVLDKYPRYKDLYFECYYHYSYCVYKTSQTIADKTKQRDYLNRAANLIVNLRKNKPDMGGEGMKKQYDELLEKEAPLKKKVEALEKGSN